MEGQLTLSGRVYTLEEIEFCLNDIPRPVAVSTMAVSGLCGFEARKIRWQSKLRHRTIFYRMRETFITGYPMRTVLNRALNEQLRRIVYGDAALAIRAAFIDLGQFDKELRKRFGEKEI